MQMIQNQSKENIRIKSSTMTPELKALILKNRGRILSDKELVSQVRSCAFGDLAIEEPATKRAAVDRAVDELFGI